MMNGEIWWIDFQEPRGSATRQAIAAMLHSALLWCDGRDEPRGFCVRSLSRVVLGGLRETLIMRCVAYSVAMNRMNAALPSSVRL